MRAATPPPTWPSGDTSGANSASRRTSQISYLARYHLAIGDLVAAEKLILEAHSIVTEEALTWTKPLLELLYRGVPSYAGDDWAHAAVLEAYLAADLLDEGLAIGEPALEKYVSRCHPTGRWSKSCWPAEQRPVEPVSARIRS